MASRIAAAIGGVTLIGFGAWSFVDPAGFYDGVAEWPPYNEHFLHDVGAFQIGLGAVLLAAMVWSDALFAALVGVGIGAALHTVAHAIDHGEGGSDSDPFTLGGLALVILAGAWFRWRERPGAGRA